MKAIEGQSFTNPVALERDKNTGWHVVALDALKSTPTAQEICAEINLLNKEEADEVVQKVTGLFQGVQGARIKEIIAKDQKAYGEALYLVDRESISTKIADFGIVNQSLLLDLAIKAAEKNLWNVVTHFENFGIVDEENRFKFALHFADKIRADDVQKLKITDPQKILHVALKKGGASDEFIADLLKRFPDEPNQVMIESLKYNIKVNNIFDDRYNNYAIVCRNLPLFKMLDEETRVQIALDMAEQGYSKFSECFADFGITKEENRFKLAMKAPDQKFITYLENYEIDNEEYLNQIALKYAKKFDFIDHFEKFKITDPVKILTLILKSKDRGDEAVSALIKRFHENPYEAILELAEISPEVIPKIVPYFGIKEENERFQLALKVAERETEKVFSNLHHFRLNDDHRYQLAAKFANSRNGWLLSAYFEKFAIAILEYSISL